MNHDDLHRRFPADFTWGVATSAFQIDGAAFEHGKGESIWDHFCRQSGAIADASNGDIACEHHERLVDGLLARGVKPLLNLNHWDTPQALQDSGGWPARDTVHRFVDYALGMQRRLGDRLATLTTHNEPWVNAVLGHEQGVFAPGLESRRTATQAAHHLLLSHGLALQAPLGIVLNLAHMMPATDTPADVEASRLADLGDDAPQVQPGDMAAIAQPLDFLGDNHRTRVVSSADGSFDIQKSGLPLTDMDWEIYPRGLNELLLTLHRDVKLPPTYITENGDAFKDPVSDGQVHDADRTACLQDHTAAVADAVDQGVPMAGHMVWSLMDNFEWRSGYAKRYGSVHVDYATQQRTLKDSAPWHRGFFQRWREPAAPKAGA